MDPTRVTEAESRGSVLLWIGTLTGPAAWSIQMLVNYNLEEIACAPATRAVGEIWGIGIGSVMLGLNIVLSCATAAAGVVAFRCWKRVRDSEEEWAQRATWMAVVGIMSSVLFLIMIGMGFAPQFFLGVCESAP